MLYLPGGSVGCRFAVRRFLSNSPAALVCTASGLVAASSRASPTGTINEIPAPKGAIPLLGHLHQLVGKDTRGKFELFESLHKKLGPIVRLKLPLGKNIVLVYNPSAAEQVLRSDGQYPIRSLLLSDNMQYLFKDAGLPVPFSFLDGKEWKNNRGLHHKQIRPANVHSYSAGINRVTNRLLKKLELSMNKEGCIEDIFPFINNWTMEGSAWITLGVDLDLRKEDSAEAKQLQQAVKKFVQSLEYMTNGLPVYKIYPTRQYKQAKQSVIAMRSIGKKYLDIISKENVKRKIEKGESVSLIEQWMIEGNMSEEQCIMSACEMFGAGIDTTANYATFLLYEVAKHPEVQEKIRQQVVSVLGEEGEADSESLQKMPYLKDVIKEAHRISPVTPGFMRDLSKDTEVMGYNIPAGTTVIYPYYIRKSDPDLCTNPDRFDPDRWSKDTDRPHPFSDLPFGFGSRACFGRRIAELELKVLLTKMCRHFDMSADGVPDNRLPHTFVTIISPGGPVKIMLSPRTDCRYSREPTTRTLL